MQVYRQYPCGVNRSFPNLKKEKKKEGNKCFLEIYPGIHIFSRIQRHPGNFHKSRDLKAILW